MTPERPDPSARYRNVGGWMVEDAEGQWMHVSDVGIEAWSLDPAAPVTDAGLDVERLAHAFDNLVNSRGLGIGITMAQWRAVAAEYAALSRQAEKETA